MLLDSRGEADGFDASPSFGECIALEDCSGTSGADPEGERCIRLACTKIAGCLACAADAPAACARCGPGLLLDSRSAQGELPASATLGRCIQREDCAGLAGESAPGSGACAYLPCASLPGCRACDEEDPTACRSCQAAYLEDRRRREPLEGEGVACLPAAECAGLFGPGEGEEAGACVPLACAADPHCTGCNSRAPELCEECAPPYQAYGGVCRDDCLVGAAAVPNCAECVEGERACARCAPGYALDAEGGCSPGGAANVSIGTLAGVAAAMAVGVAVVVVAVGVSVFCCVRKRKAGAVA